MNGLAKTRNVVEAAADAGLVGAKIFCLGDTFCLVSVFAGDWLHEHFGAKEKNDEAVDDNCDDFFDFDFAGSFLFLLFLGLH